MTRYWIEEKAECSYCGGSERCYTCDGKGGTEEFGYCSDCDSRGVCMQCIGGREQWLFFEAPGGGVRGSCLTRDEARVFIRNKTLPEWWAAYHGVALDQDEKDQVS